MDQDVPPSSQANFFDWTSTLNNNFADNTIQHTLNEQDNEVRNFLNMSNITSPIDKQIELHLKQNNIKTQPITDQNEEQNEMQNSTTTDRNPQKIQYPQVIQEPTPSLQPISSIDPESGLETATTIGKARLTDEQWIDCMSLFLAQRSTSQQYNGDQNANQQKCMTKNPQTIGSASLDAIKSAVLGMNSVASTTDMQHDITQSTIATSAPLKPLHNMLNGIDKDFSVLEQQQQQTATTSKKIKTDILLSSNEPKSFVDDLIIDSREYFKQLKLQKKKEENETIQENIDILLETSKLSKEARESIEFQHLKNIIELENQIKPFMDYDSDDDDNSISTTTTQDKKISDNTNENNNLNQSNEKLNPLQIMIQQIYKDQQNNNDSFETDPDGNKLFKIPTTYNSEVSSDILKQGFEEIQGDKKEIKKNKNKNKKIFSQNDWQALQDLKRQLRSNLCKMYQPSATSSFRMDLTQAHYINAQMYNYIVDKIAYFRTTKQNERLDLLNFMFDLRHNLVKLQVHVNSSSDDDDDDNTYSDDDGENNTYDGEYADYENFDAKKFNRQIRKNKKQAEALKKKQQKKQRKLERNKRANINDTIMLDTITTDDDGDGDDDEVINESEVAKQLALALINPNIETISPELQERLNIHIESIIGMASEQSKKKEKKITKKFIKQQTRQFLKNNFPSSKKNIDDVDDSIDNDIGDMNDNSTETEEDNLGIITTDEDDEDEDDIFDESQLAPASRRERAHQGMGKAPRSRPQALITGILKTSSNMESDENDDDKNDDENDDDDKNNKNDEKFHKPHRSAVSRMFESVLSTSGTPFIPSDDSDDDDDDDSDKNNNDPNSKKNIKQHSISVFKSLTPQERLDLLSHSESVIPHSSDYSMLSTNEVAKKRQEWLSEQETKLDISEEQVLSCLTSEYEILQFYEMCGRNMFTKQWELQPWVKEELDLLDPIKYNSYLNKKKEKEEEYKKEKEEEEKKESHVITKTINNFRNTSEMFDDDDDDNNNANNINNIDGHVKKPLSNDDDDYNDYNENDEVREETTMYTSDEYDNLNDDEKLLLNDLSSTETKGLIHLMHQMMISTPKTLKTTTTVSAIATATNSTDYPNLNTKLFNSKDNAGSKDDNSPNSIKSDDNEANNTVTTESYNNEKQNNQFQQQFQQQQFQQQQFQQQQSHQHDVPPFASTFIENSYFPTEATVTSEEFHDLFIQEDEFDSYLSNLQLSSPFPTNGTNGHSYNNQGQKTSNNMPLFSHEQAQSLTSMFENDYTHEQDGTHTSDTAIGQKSVTSHSDISDAAAIATKTMTTIKPTTATSTTTTTTTTISPSSNIKAQEYEEYFVNVCKNELDIDITDPYFMNTLDVETREKFEKLLQIRQSSDEMITDNFTQDEIDRFLLDNKYPTTKPPKSLINESYGYDITIDDDDDDVIKKLSMYKKMKQSIDQFQQDWSDPVSFIQQNNDKDDLLSTTHNIQKSNDLYDVHYVPATLRRTEHHTSLGKYNNQSNQSNK